MLFLSHACMHANINCGATLEDSTSVLVYVAIIVCMWLCFFFCSDFVATIGGDSVAGLPQFCVGCFLSH